MTSTTWPAATRAIDDWDFVDEPIDNEDTAEPSRWRDVSDDPQSENPDDFWVYLDESGVVGLDNAAHAWLPDPGLATAELLDSWHCRFAHTSSIRRASRAPEYKLILLIGADAVPMVLDRLRVEPDPLWIWLLGDLAEVDPAEGTTTISDAAEKWLRWGERRHTGRVA